jgi:membrane associated rhomboid family serine protease
MRATHSIWASKRGCGKVNHDAYIGGAVAGVMLVLIVARRQQRRRGGG